MSLIDFPIKNRWTGEIQFTATIDASETSASLETFGSFRSFIR